MYDGNSAYTLSRTVLTAEFLKLADAEVTPHIEGNAFDLGEYKAVEHAEPEISQCQTQDEEEVVFSGNKGEKLCRLYLWYFLLELLDIEETSGIISWTDRSTLEFKIHNAKELALMWGQLHGRKNMTYAKFSRALRYHYKKGVLRKVPKKRYCYQFLKCTKVNCVIKANLLKKNDRDSKDSLNKFTKSIEDVVFSRDHAATSENEDVKPTVQQDTSPLNKVCIQDLSELYSCDSNSSFEVLGQYVKDELQLQETISKTNLDNASDIESLLDLSDKHMRELIDEFSESTSEDLKIKETRNHFYSSSPPDCNNSFKEFCSSLSSREVYQYNENMNNMAASPTTDFSGETLQYFLDDLQQNSGITENQYTVNGGYSNVSSVPIQFTVPQEVSSSYNDFGVLNEMEFQNTMNIDKSVGMNFMTSSMSLY